MAPTVAARARGLAAALAPRPLDMSSAPQEASAAAAAAGALSMPRLLGSGSPTGAARADGGRLEKPGQPPRSPEAAVDWATMEPMKVAVPPMEARLEPMRVELTRPAAPQPREQTPAEQQPPGRAAAPPAPAQPAAGPPGRFFAPCGPAAAAPPRRARPAAAGPRRDAPEQLAARAQLEIQGLCPAPPPGLSRAGPDLQGGASCGPGAPPLASTRASESSCGAHSPFACPAADAEGSGRPPFAGARADEPPSGAPPPPGRAGAGGPARRKRGAAREGRFTSVFVFTGFDCDEHADFELVPRLIGRGGCNMRAIAQACDGKVRVRGRGSGHREGEDDGREADVPLQIALSCRSHAALQLGLGMLLEVLASTSSHFARYCRARGIDEPEQLYQIL